MIYEEILILILFPRIPAFPRHRNPLPQRENPGRQRKKARGSALNQGLLELFAAGFGLRDLNIKESTPQDEYRHYSRAL
jgi:hypothetical protein